MNVNLGDYYEMKLRNLIAKGIASNKTEAMRMAITAYERQIEDEEAQMVIDRVAEEKAVLGGKKEKTISLDEFFKKHGIDKNKI